MELLFFSEMIAILSDFVTALVDVLKGRMRRRIEQSIYIDAQPDVVWQAVWSGSDFKGALPMDYHVDPLPYGEALYRVSFAYHDIGIESTIRLIEAREGEAYLAEYLQNDPEIDEDQSDHHYYGAFLRKEGSGTTLTQFDELTSYQFSKRILFPLFSRWMLRRFKEGCEQTLENEEESSEHSSTLAFLTASLVFFVSWKIFDFNLAVFVLAILFIHEYGTQLAAGLIGRSPPRLPMMPFSSVFNFETRKSRSFFEEALEGLMGPAFSLIPAVILYLTYVSTGLVAAGIGAAFFAVINLSQLLPVMPLGGGHIARAFLRSLRSQDCVMAGWSALFFGLLLALYSHSFLFAFLVILGVSQLSDLSEVREEEEQKKPLSPEGLFVILSVVCVTIGVYGGILYRVLGDAAVSGFFGLI